MSLPIAYLHADSEYRFVDTVQAEQRGDLFFVELAQQGTKDAARIGELNPIHGVARLVMAPAFFDTLIEQLSSLRESAL
jgi:hypothetical protein